MEKGTQYITSIQKRVHNTLVQYGKSVHNILVQYGIKSTICDRLCEKVQIRGIVNVW